MVESEEERPDLTSLLPQILKGLRRRRNLKAADVASRLDMPLRSYEHFESGKARLNLDRIHRVADLLDADPFAIRAAVEMRSPMFALRCADNKLMMIFMMALEAFDLEVGDAIARLDPLTLMDAFTQLFDALAARAQEQQAVLSQSRGGRSDPET